MPVSEKRKKDFNDYLLSNSSTLSSVESEILKLKIDFESQNLALLGDLLFCLFKKTQEFTLSMLIFGQTTYVTNFNPSKLKITHFLQRVS